MSRVIGIDLGTTNSCAAIVEGGKPIIIPNELGERLTMSVVRITEDGEGVVGEYAYRARMVDPLNTITGIKRFIGRRFNEVIDIARSVPFKVVSGRNNLAMIETQGNLYSPQMVSAMILKSLKDSAEHYLGEPVEMAVITVPAYFNDYQKEATREAGQMAGLRVRRIINEPTAAALVYGLDKKRDKTVAVFDFGGGTFDVSILEVGEGVNEVKAISGDGFLGGDDFDEAVAAWVVEEMTIEHGINISDNVTSMQRVREAATEAKCALSEMTQTRVVIPFLDVGGRTENVELVLTRAKFEQLCEELFERLIFPCESALKDSGATRLDEVLLVGGASRMPKSAEIAKKIFGVDPKKAVNPDEAVALGAAIEAAIIEGRKTDQLLLDVVPKALGVEIVGGIALEMIPNNTTIPTRKSEIFSTWKDNQTSVEVNVIEGNQPLAIDNRSMGRLVLNGIPPAPSGIPQIEITFDIDANSTVKVYVKDMGTGREASLVLKASTGLTDYELSRVLPRVRTH